MKVNERKVVNNVKWLQSDLWSDDCRKECLLSIMCDRENNDPIFSMCQDWPAVCRSDRDDGSHHPFISLFFFITELFLVFLLWRDHTASITLINRTVFFLTFIIFSFSNYSGSIEQRWEWEELDFCRDGGFTGKRMLEWSFQKKRTAKEEICGSGHDRCLLWQRMIRLETEKRLCWSLIL